MYGFYQVFEERSFSNISMTQTTASMALNIHLEYYMAGLYGLLRPADLIQNHRLEMGTKKLPLPDAAKDLYTLWATPLADSINEQFETTAGGVLLNCASEEYFNVIPLKKLDGNISVVTCVFLDGGKVKSVYAKRARGMMARFACGYCVIL